MTRDELFRLDRDTRIETVDRLWGELDAGRAGKPRGNIQIVTAVTRFGSVDHLRHSLTAWGYTVEGQWGNLFLVSAHREVPFYALLDGAVVYFITLARKTEDIPGTILNYLGSVDDAVLLRMGPERMRRVRHELARAFPGIVLSYFTAHRDPHTPLRPDHRPEVQRTVIYSGNDGYDTLEEMEHHYGISARIMEFHHRGTVYGRIGIRLDVNGIFTITDGPSLLIRPILERLVKDHLDMALKVGFSPGGGDPGVWKGGRTADAPEPVHGGVGRYTGTLGRRWNGSDLERFETALSSDWDITGFLTVRKPGKEFFHSRLVDVTHRSIWDMTLSRDRFTVAPAGDSDAHLRSLMKLAEVLDEHLGPVSGTGDEQNGEEQGGGQGLRSSGVPDKSKDPDTGVGPDPEEGAPDTDEGPGTDEGLDTDEEPDTDGWPHRGIPGPNGVGETGSFKSGRGAPSGGNPPGDGPEGAGDPESEQDRLRNRHKRQGPEVGE